MISTHRGNHQYFFGSKYESGIGNPTNLTTSSKNNKLCNRSQRPFYTTKSSASHIIPLHPLTILTIMSIASGLIKVNNWPILLVVLYHSTKVSVPLFNNARLLHNIIIRNVMVTQLKPISLNKMLTTNCERGYPFLRQQASSTVSHALCSDGGSIFFI